MPRVDFVESRIFAIEGFAVVIKYNGRDSRGDANLPKQYEASRMMRNSCNVSRFKEKFKTQFPGYDIDVLKGDGKKANSRMLLSNVRDTYLENNGNE